MALSNQITDFLFAGGIGGLAAASAALKHFDLVTLVDRDDLRGRIGHETILQASRRSYAEVQVLQKVEGSCSLTHTLLTERHLF